MPETSDDADYADRLAARSEGLKDAWGATIADMEALAEEYEAEGWQTVTIPAGHTAPEPPDSGVEGRFGLVYVIPDNYAERFTEAFEAGEFPRYDVFRNEASGQVFVVTALLDTESETVILIAGGFERHNARSLVATAVETGEMYTHVQTLDGTPLGSFRHDDPEKFFPTTDFAEQ